MNKQDLDYYVSQFTLPISITDIQEKFGLSYPNAHEVLRHIHIKAKRTPEFIKNQIKEFEKAYTAYNDERPNTHRFNLLHIYEKSQKEVDVTGLKLRGETSVKGLIELLKDFNDEDYVIDFNDIEDYDGFRDGTAITIRKIIDEDDSDVLEYYLNDRIAWSYNAAQTFTEQLKSINVLEHVDFYNILNLSQEYERYQLELLKKVNKNELITSNEILDLINRQGCLREMIDNL